MLTRTGERQLVDKDHQRVWLGGVFLPAPGSLWIRALSKQMQPSLQLPVKFVLSPAWPLGDLCLSRTGATRPTQFYIGSWGLSWEEVRSVQRSQQGAHITHLPWALARRGAEFRLALGKRLQGTILPHPTGQGMG